MIEYGTWQARNIEEKRDDAYWRKLARQLHRAEGHVGLFGHVRLKGFTLKRKDDHWQWIARAQVRDKHQVAFIDCVDIVEGFSNTLHLLDTNSVSWVDDKFHESNK